VEVAVNPLNAKKLRQSDASPQPYAREDFSHNPLQTRDLHAICRKKDVKNAKTKPLSY
jgi:hypothetical protein